MQTETFTHKRFCTQMLLHTDAFTHRHFYTKTRLHTEAFTPRSLHTHTRKLLHTDAFKHRHFYTQTLLDTNVFTHRRFYTQTRLHGNTLTHIHFYTQTLLHTDAFTQRSFYTQKLLHTDTFTHRRFYTQTLSHTEAFTHRRSWPALGDLHSCNPSLKSRLCNSAVRMWARTCSLMLSHRQVCNQQLYYSLSTKLTTKSQSILVDLCRCATTSLNKCLNSRLVSATASTTNVTNILFAIILTSKHSAVSGLHNLASNELQMENIDFTPATWTCHVWFVPTQIPKPKSDYVNVIFLSLRTTHSNRNQRQNWI